MTDTTAFDLPKTITNEDGETLNLCPGGCGTYVDPLNVSPYCQRCEFDILVGPGIPRAQMPAGFELWTPER